MNIAYSTEHATARLRQRGIPLELLELLVEYGEERYDGHGARVLGFSKRTRERLRKDVGKKVYARWESRLNVFAVVANNEALVTVGHRLRRLSTRS